jgi:uncharacterized membrane-anchored protein YjiN (DUF445 family)
VVVFETRRGELIAVANKMLNKLYLKYDINKVVKEYLKVLVGNSNHKSKAEIISQLIQLLRESEQKETESRSIR